MPSSAELVCVDPARVIEIWPHVRGLIEKAIARSEWSADVIATRLLNGSQLLWLTWDGVIRAVCVTELISAPSGRICNIVCCAGEDDNWPERIKPIEAYAKEAGCNAMRVQGRRGWERILKDYEFEWVSLAKRLD